MERLHSRLKNFSGLVAEETNPMEELRNDERDGSDPEENDGSATASEGSGN